MAVDDSITDFCCPTKTPKQLNFSRFFKKTNGGLYVAKAPLMGEELIYCARYLIAHKFKCGEVLRSVGKAKDFFIAELAAYEKEVFVVLFLDVGNRILGYEQINTGSVTYANIYLRDLVKLVLTKNATAIIIAHNHLSSNVTPSQADISITLKISSLLQEVETTLLDHIIVGGGKAFSFSEQKLMSAMDDRHKGSVCRTVSV